MILALHSTIGWKTLDNLLTTERRLRTQLLLHAKIQLFCPDFSGRNIGQTIQYQIITCSMPTGTVDIHLHNPESEFEEAANLRATRYYLERKPSSMYEYCTVYNTKRSDTTYACPGMYNWYLLGLNCRYPPRIAR